MPEILETVSGHHVPGIIITPKLLINKSISLFGSSGTGKSVAINYFLNILNSKVDQFVLTSPSEPANEDFVGRMHKPMTHYALNKDDPEDKKDTELKQQIRFLKCIFDRQTMLTTMSKLASNFKILKGLYKKLPANVQDVGNEVINKLKHSKRNAVKKLKKKFRGDEEKLGAKTQEVKKMFETFLVGAYQKLILPFREKLLMHEKEITKEEENALLYLIMNPHMAVIFDDCSDLLKKVQSNPVMQAYFYRNRHVKMTAIYCWHSLKNLESSLRDNTFINVFTCKKMAIKYFTNKTNAFEKEDRDRALGAADVIFKVPYRALVYIRNDKTKVNFYHLTCQQLAPKMLGSAALAELCDRVKAKELTLDRTNQFYDKFNI